MSSGGTYIRLQLLNYVLLFSHPIDVVEDDLVGRLQVESRASRLGADEEDVDAERVLLGESLDHLRALVLRSVAVQTDERVPLARAQHLFCSSHRHRPTFVGRGGRHRIEQHRSGHVG